MWYPTHGSTNNIALGKFRSPVSMSQRDTDALPDSVTMSSLSSLCIFSKLKVRDQGMTHQVSRALPVSYCCCALHQSLTVPVFHTVTLSSPRPSSASCAIELTFSNVCTEVLCSDDVVKVLQFLLSDSGYQFSVLHQTVIKLSFSLTVTQ